MKEIPLTKGYVAIVDDEDFDRVNQFNWYAQGSPKTGVYAARRDKRTRKTVYMHRFILGAPPEFDVDHRETAKKLDNRRGNLRLATRSQNGANQNKSAGRSSRFKGVSRHRRLKKWEAYITVGGELKHLGFYHLEEWAAVAYDWAAKKFFGEFANLNFPGPRVRLGEQ